MSAAPVMDRRDATTPRHTFPSGWELTASPSPMQPAATAVLVGLDGSRPAAAAAVWAIDEATTRDLPLRLIHAVAPAAGGQVGADDLARAAHIVDTAVTAVEAAGKAVRVEAQILCGAAAPTLTAASHDAAMLCLGVTEPAGHPDRHGRSTVAEVTSVVRCPVAIVHPTERRGAGQVVVEVTHPPADDDAALARAVDEALLRAAPLRVVATWPCRYPDIHDDDAVARKNRLVRARWERRLSRWRERYPDLDVHVTALGGSVLNYRARHRDDISMTVLPHDRAGDVAELLTPGVDCGFDILICGG
ncbi:universal stress protein [Mycolicibacterium sp.]|uniref:universal stress protein n=1 Tax=Mycolicibacterium sp. TaxID=2320850 RepID=UPI003D0D8E4A